MNLLDENIRQDQGLQLRRSLAAPMGEPELLRFNPKSGFGRDRTQRTQSGMALMRSSQGWLVWCQTLR